MDSMDSPSAAAEADLSSGRACVTWPMSFEPRLMGVPSAALASLSLVAVTLSPGLALPASMGLESVALNSEEFSAAALVCWVPADAVVALLLPALALPGPALTVVPELADALPCTGGSAANAAAVNASKADKNTVVVHLFITQLL